MSPAGSAFSGLAALAATGERARGSAADTAGSDGRRHTGAVPTPPLLADSSKPTSAHTSPAGSLRLSASSGGAKTGDIQSGWPDQAPLAPLDSALQGPAATVQAGAANAHSVEDAEPGPKFIVHGIVGTAQALDRVTVSAAGVPPPERAAGLRRETCSDRSPPREPWLLRLKLAKSAVPGLRERLTAVAYDSRAKTASLKNSPPGEQGELHAVSTAVGRSVSGEPLSMASSHRSSRALGEPNDLLEP